MILSRPLSVNIGEVILNKHVTELDKNDIDEIKFLLNFKKAVFFNKQFLNENQIIELGKKLSNSLSERLECQTIDSTQNYYYGSGWHSDLSYKDTIPNYTIFQIEFISENTTGDTEFCDTVSLYNYGFSSYYKLMLDNLLASHRYLSFSRRQNGIEMQTYHYAEHPVVLKTLVNGTEIKSIFANESHTDKILNVRSTESDSILSYIFNSINQYTEFKYRHNWKNGDLVIWNNRLSQHKAIKDFPKDVLRIAKRCLVY